MVSANPLDAKRFSAETETSFTSGLRPHTKVDEIEEFVNGGGGGEVLNVDGTASGSVGSTESNLEGSGRILRMCSDQRVRS